MRELVRQLAGDGITVLLSSHLMVEVEQLCNRVAIIQEGEIRYEGELPDLLARSGGRYRLEATDPALALELARAVAGVHDVHEQDGVITFAAERQPAAALTVALGRAGIGLHALVPHAPTLEELFFDIIEGDGRAGP